MKLKHFEIDTAVCRKCGVCAASCPQGAIVESTQHVFSIDTPRCDNCALCVPACKLRAIVKRWGPGKPAEASPSR